MNIIKKNFDGSLWTPEPLDLKKYYELILTEVEKIKDCPRLMALTLQYFTRAQEWGRLTSVEQLTTDNIIKVIKYIEDKDDKNQI